MRQSVVNTRDQFGLAFSDVKGAQEDLFFGQGDLCFEGQVEILRIVKNDNVTLVKGETRSDGVQLLEDGLQPRMELLGNVMGKRRIVRGVASRRIKGHGPR